MKKTWWGLIATFILCLLALGGKSTAAQSERSLYFPETGHWIRDEFLTYYESVSDPELLFGAPITEAFFDPERGRWIQYFQKARLVLDPSSPLELRVKQTPLGQEIYVSGEAPSFTPNSSNCREFSLDPEQNYRVCYAFLDFFETHGGLVQFGYPISNFEIQNGRIVQYFQNAKFEWHPELPSRQRVVLSNLGWEYFHKVKEDPELLLPSLQDNLPVTILSLKVLTFVEQAVMPFRGEQTLNVIVQDQNLQPISNAEVSFSVRMPSGKTDHYFMPTTDENGVTKLPFYIVAQTHGVAEIVVEVNYEGLNAVSRGSFRIWW